MQNRDTPAQDPSGPEIHEPARDPRLEIPEILRTPIRRPPERAKPPVMERWSDTARAWGLAMEFVASIVGGVVLGWLIDQAAGTGPAFAVGGLVVGFVGAFVRIVKQSAKDAKKGKERAAAKAAGGGSDAGRTGGAGFAGRKEHGGGETDER